ncbi:hypothetical protein O2N63_13315 [Aliiroseovarius sp. KMU-50]|uniref:Uncharacterized protein n=1 Tax=Aliiroseovarius salicola TaxID=3009082 RepID=A0ABT4W3G0_9RHOB|nr:hypothetical protein [Aliiroseovarius sp. KMU-50]MDA5095063.1 hypothetical protein [Aliiroseovarius sp. KMU-50]
MRDYPMYQMFQYVFAIVAVVVIPTVSMLSYYAWTGDPSLRPLAASVDRLRGYFVGSDDILIEVYWGEHVRSVVSQSDVKHKLRSAFLSKGINAHVVIRPHSGSSGIQVSYRVGMSEFGPMHLTETPRAVQSVVEAYRMAQKS